MIFAIIIMMMNLLQTFASFRRSLRLSRLTRVSLDAVDQHPTVAFQESCTESQLETIRLQIPSTECFENRERPYFHGGSCSFSYATRCPGPRWLQAYYLGQAAPSKGRRQALYIGSNQGMDAVNTLRLLSSNHSYSMEKWRIMLEHDSIAPATSPNCTENLAFDMPARAAGVPAHADVYCVEPNRGVAGQFADIGKRLQYEAGLHIMNAAVLTEDAAEGNVPRYRLDTFVEKHVDAARPIDILSLNLGGDEAAILLDAEKVFSRVQYLDFVYTWRGIWAKHTLSSVIDRLASKGFVCYWAGTGGNLWRITGCWMPHYDVQVWSHVACVQRNHTGLLQQMERNFAQTLDAGYLIYYNNRLTAETDGRF